MQFPTVHLNGTGKQYLSDQFERAEKALRLALEALHYTAPHGRDYYPQGDQAFEIARKEHCDRSLAVEKVHTDMVALILHMGGF